ncbi:hypothetical protein C8J57DRAFT_1534359 [Mycena rebaudengoi]|nr:hypothetical protein C8J57DRAFT_1534359 [Mycena rebaudengoi]
MSDSEDDFGVDGFSQEFMSDLEKAEEVFPSSFGALPPSSVASLLRLQDSTADNKPAFRVSSCVRVKTEPVETDGIPTSEYDLTKSPAHVIIVKTELEAGIPPTRLSARDSGSSSAVSSSPYRFFGGVNAVKRKRGDSRSRTSTNSDSDSDGVAKRAKIKRSGTTSDSLSDSDSESDPRDAESGAIKPKLDAVNQPSHQALSARDATQRRVETRILTPTDTSSVSHSDSDSETEPAETVSKKLKVAPSYTCAQDSDTSDSDSDIEVFEEQPRLTHLENFFSSYPKFEYDPFGPASQQYQTLKSIYRDDRDNIHRGYNKAMGLTLSQLYGDNVNSLESFSVVRWSSPTSPIPSRSVVLIKSAHVNLVNLVDVHNTGKPVHRFQSERELAAYTRRNKKFFPPPIDTDIFDPPHSTMDPELVISEPLAAPKRAPPQENASLKAQNRELTAQVAENARKNKLFKLKAQVELLKAEIDTLNQNLVEVTKSEQKSIQRQAKLKTKYQNQKNIRSDLQRKCEELMENNKELATALNKRPALPPNGPSAAKWRERCEKLQEQYQTLQRCYKQLKTELQELKEAYRGFASLTSTLCK